MNTHIDRKERRAMLIHLELIELEKLFGRTAPTPYPWLQPTLRLVKGTGGASSLPFSSARNARAGRATPRDRSLC